MASREDQVPWNNPAETSKVTGLPSLEVLNTITKNKVPFVPNDRIVTWYACGPTVYDVSHIGHARNYVSFDIVRRIMEDYFGFNIHMVMNVTDIDDKIINRSNERGEDHVELARRFEAAFWKDMKDLNVRPPHTITRVSEYIDEIGEFVLQIVKNGLAYESNGSVYFDTQEFMTRKNKDGECEHFYGKLQPNSINDSCLQAEGEGALSQNLGTKKNQADFALWKASKPGEPWWEPKGLAKGRPGWHIECSAMASNILGENIDIHSGGVDLKFPHHDNELAQSEAHYGCSQWINYFMHAGHLHIQGLKMSKSLKNFISIENSLQRWTARQIRFLFLTHKYHEGMDYSEPAMAQILDTEAVFTNAFNNIRAAVREWSENANRREKYDAKEFALLAAHKAAEKEVHEALCDNFDTPRVVTALQDLIKEVNKYLNQPFANGSLLELVGRYVTRIMAAFGMVEGSDSIGWAEGSEGMDRETAMTPALNVLTQFRETVRNAAMAKDVNAIMAACDALRDEVLPPIGVLLEDRPGQSAMWKLDSPEAIMASIQQKKNLADEKARKKAEARARQEAAQAAKMEKGKINPAEMFKNEKYSEWDDQGMPTKLANGEPVTKSQSKSLAKEYKVQVKLHDWYNAELKKTEP